MADKPAKYWDHRECRWVACPAPADEVVVPAQPKPADAEAAPEQAPPAVGASA